MPSFARSFAVDALARWDAEHPGNVVRRLFQRWALPTQHSTGSYMLRVGIRDGYLNLYVKGQSVAKLSIRDNGPLVEVHEAYVTGRQSTDKRAGDGPRGQRYIPFHADLLAKPETAELIPNWIATAESYASAEKRFVDRLIASNPSVIDLEMGLPAGEAVAGEGKSAPRMDLVVAQGEYGKPRQIAFWEAKCSINSELRAEADYLELDGKRVAGPKVIHQLRKYQQWMSQDNRITQVQAAYSKTATILLDLANLFGKTDRDPLRAWADLAATKEPEVILPPGVVIGNYCPDGHEPAKAGGKALFAKRAESFGRHREELERHGITVYELGYSSDMPLPHSLPRLHAGMVTA
jgi:hypothetical protein